ncbi:MAG: hypothetical protein KF745_01055 [Phycisphaeraceae bacterium]|nr:hypothetical protein [Phycisphaeraceae bacterium]
MFLRRLLLLGVMLVAAVVVPGVQLARWTIGESEELRRRAERRMIDERLVPTRRGSILDRRGRVLAMDRPSYDIAVDYQVITGRWALTQAARKARRENRGNWSSLSTEQRQALVDEYLPEFEQRLEAMWAQFAFVAGISREHLERRRNEVRLQVQTLASKVWSKQDEEQELRLAKGSETEGDGEGGGEVAGAARTPRIRAPIREQVIPHVLLHDVDDQTAFAFQRLVASEAAQGARSLTGLGSLPGLKVIDASSREYPLETIEVLVDRSTFPMPLRDAQPASVSVGGVATHVIGWMRSGVQERDIEARKRILAGSDGGAEAREDLGAYQPGDSVGAFGIEAGLEYELRGIRGLIREHLDTGERTTVAPVPGHDVRLTIDAMLQARIQALFDPSLGLAVVQSWQSNPPPINLGERLDGAAVVIDVDSGDILAMATTPTFTREQYKRQIGEMLKDTRHQPLLNRAIQKAYMPGSIVKPLVLCAAATNGNYRTDQRIACTGHLLPNDPNIFRCWIYKQYKTTHSEKLGHDLDGADAIMGSCNIFFFELGRRMGPAAVVDWFGKFGVGADAVHPDLGLYSQRADGSLAPLQFPGLSARIGQTAPTISEAILMGIGQGPIAWTPLHAAEAYATLARAGLRVPARLLADAPGSPPIDLHLDPRAVAQALEGLRRATSEADGTANHLTISIGGTQSSEPIFNAPGVLVRAKSGTATARIEMADIDGDGLNETKVYIDHAWCVALVGDARDGRPQYAIAVVADEAGSGGKAAGPIANQVVHALIAEGYLNAPLEADAAEHP